MGNQNKGVLIVLQEFGEPFDMFNVQIVGRLVQQQNLGVLQQQLSKQNLAALLTAGKLADVFIKTDAAKTEAIGKFFNFAVQGIETAVLQFRLDFTDGIHHFIKLFGRSIAHFIVQLQHLLFHSIMPSKAVRRTSRIVMPFSRVLCWSR